MKHTVTLRNSRTWTFSIVVLLTMTLSMVGGGQAYAAPADARTQEAIQTNIDQEIIPANLTPQTPALVAPANGTTNIPVPATLSVTVTDPDANPMDVTFYGRPLQPAGGPDFTIVTIPDTQYYAEFYPSIFNAQLQWVVDNMTTDNIVYVSHLGDIVDIASSTNQWDAANSAYNLLDAVSMPYGLAVGNHDIAIGGSTTNFNNYFGLTRFTGKPYYGGHYGSNNDNHYDLISASGLDFIIIYIKYDDSMTSLPNPVLTWADGLLSTYSSRRAIVISHNMLQDATSTAFSPQGQTIYNALINHPNLFLMMGGHNDIASRRTDTSAYGTVYSMKSDYQYEDSFQSGYLRILRFSPAHNMIFFRTYSPTQAKDYDNSDATENNFSLPYAMNGVGFQEIGTVRGVASGGTATLSWAGLAPGAQYEWYAVTTDGTHQSWSEVWNFTTQDPTPTTYSISGNAGVADATLTYNGGSTTTDGSGDYSFSVLPGWSGTVTPSAPGYLFSPENIVYPNVEADQTDQNYTPTANPSFADVPPQAWYWHYVEVFFANGITTGCAVNPLQYCPDQAVTRAEMAVFILRAQNGGSSYQPNPSPTDMFADVPVAGKEWMKPWIEQFYNDGLTTGCYNNPLQYCPEREVTRAEMAVFVLRAIHGGSYQPPTASGFFADVPVAGKDWMQAWIDEYYREGMTTGCLDNPLRYCPEQSVTRAEMATFIDRAFGFVPLP